MQGCGGCASTASYSYVLEDKYWTELAPLIFPLNRQRSGNRVERSNFRTSQHGSGVRRFVDRRPQRSAEELASCLRPLELFCVGAQAFRPPRQSKARRAA